MTPPTRQLMGMAVVLFVIAGLRTSMGLSGDGVSNLMLFGGAAAALIVIIRDSTRGEMLKSIIGAVLLSALGFGLGWGVFQYLLRADVLP